MVGAGENNLSAVRQQSINRRLVGGNVWLGRAKPARNRLLSDLPSRELNYEVIASEEAVGRAMLDEIEAAAYRLLHN